MRQDEQIVFDQAVKLAIAYVQMQHSGQRQLPSAEIFAEEYVSAFRAMLPVIEKG